MLREVRQKKLVPSILHMFVWTSGSYNPLAQTHFNMFVDEWTNANESPVKCLEFLIH